MMFHEPFLGQLTCSIDLLYFARWLRDGDERRVVARQVPPEIHRDLETAADHAEEQAKARLLMDSAVGEYRMF